MNPDDLVSQTCKPCEGGVAPLTATEAQDRMQALHPDWKLTEDGKSIARHYTFPNYSYSSSFANLVAWIATCEGHHPVITLEYGSCDVSWTTHAIDGLSDNDFICAAKIDRCVATVNNE